LALHARPTRRGSDTSSHHRARQLSARIAFRARRLGNGGNHPRTPKSGVRDSITGGRAACETAAASARNRGAWRAARDRADDARGRGRA
jgi:hypothetical protein